MQQVKNSHNSQQFLARAGMCQDFAMGPGCPSIFSSYNTHYLYWICVCSAWMGWFLAFIALITVRIMGEQR